MIEITISPQGSGGHLWVTDMQLDVCVYDLPISLRPKEVPTERYEIDLIAKRYDVNRFRLWRAVEEFTKGGGFASVRWRGGEIEVL